MGANLFNANLSGANLSNVRIYKTDIRTANLCDANLRKAMLQNSNLSGADIRDANLRSANLCNSNLRDAKLKGANLCGAALRGANLRGADLRMADLRSSYLSGADISGTIFFRTAFEEWEIDGIKCDYVYFDYEGKERIPKDRNFRSGEFEELYKQLPTIEYVLKNGLHGNCVPIIVPVLPTIEYHFENGFTPIDAIVIDKVVQAINEKHPEFKLKLDSFHSRGQPHAVFTVLHKEYADEAIRQIKLDYEIKIKNLEGKQESLMEVISMYMNKPQIQYNIEKIVQAEKIEDNSRNIHAGRDVKDSTLAAGNGNKL